MLEVLLVIISSTKFIHDYPPHSLMGD